jgi:hypothetical protein
MLCPVFPWCPVEFLQLRKTRSFRQIIFLADLGAKVGFSLENRITVLNSSCKAKIVLNYLKSII